MKQTLEAVSAPSEQDTGSLELSRRPRNLRGWFTVKELTADLRFPSEKACRSWLTRQGIASVRRGRIILVSGVDVDKALRKVGA